MSDEKQHTLTYNGQKSCLRCVFLEKHITHGNAQSSADSEACMKHGYEFRRSITELHKTKTMGLDPSDYVCQDFEAQMPKQVAASSEQLAEKDPV